MGKSIKAYQTYYFCCGVLRLIGILHCDSQKYKGLYQETQFYLLQGILFL